MNFIVLILFCLFLSFVNPNAPFLSTASQSTTSSCGRGCDYCCQRYPTIPEEDLGLVEIWNDSNFMDLWEANSTIFLHASASWCSTCRTLEPVWVELAKKLQGSGIIIAKSDVWENQELGLLFDVTEFPTLLFIHNEMVEVYSGVRELSALKSYALKMKKKVEKLKKPKEDEKPTTCFLDKVWIYQKVDNSWTQASYLLKQNHLSCSGEGLQDLALSTKSSPRALLNAALPHYSCDEGLGSFSTSSIPINWVVDP